MRGAFAFDADPGGWLAAVSAGALYFLGAILIILNHPPAYLFTRPDLPGVWGLPIGLVMVGDWRGCMPGTPAIPATARWGRLASCWPWVVCWWSRCWRRCYPLPSLAVRSPSLRLWSLLAWRP